MSSQQMKRDPETGRFIPEQFTPKKRNFLVTVSRYAIAAYRETEELLESYYHGFGAAAVLISAALWAYMVYTGQAFALEALISLAVGVGWSAIILGLILFATISVIGPNTWKQQVLRKPA